MLLSHYVPWRSCRASGEGESVALDSKVASSALSAEAAVSCVHRAMNGFIGPKDVFRNPNALFKHFQPEGEED